MFVNLIGHFSGSLKLLTKKYLFYVVNWGIIFRCKAKILYSGWIYGKISRGSPAAGHLWRAVDP
jgi:hypothetical protein